MSRNLREFKYKTYRVFVKDRLTKRESCVIILEATDIADAKSQAIEEKGETHDIISAVQI